jgi:predicted permease
MDWVRELWARAQASRGRAATEREMAEEIAFHLAEAQREYERRGSTPAEAQRLAKLSFGSVDRFQEEARGEERARWLEQFIEDVRYALRAFGRQKLWSLSIVLVLALGVGANTAMFSLVDAVLFRKPDAVRPDELVRIYSSRAEDEYGTSYPLFLDYRSARGLSGVAANSLGAWLNVVVGNQQAERVPGTLVSGNYFELLGTRPAAGRLLSPQDDRAKGAHPVVVLSYDYWRRAFAGERSAIGNTLRVNGTVFTVIGVAPRGFRGESFDHDTQMWLSTAMTEVAQPDWQPLKPLERRGFAWLDLVARLRPGATLAQVEAQLNSIARAAENNRERPVQVTVRRASDVTITIDRVAAAARLSWILLGVVALVLLLACADVAALLIARAEHRRRELAVRLALGATRARLIRQLLAESLLLAVAGATGAIAVAALLRRAAAGFIPNEFLIPVNSATALFDARILALTAGTSVLCALVFGSVPAFAATRVALSGVLRGHATVLRIFGGVRLTLRDALVVVQLGVCLVFLTGAALLGRSLHNAAALDLGFARTGVVMGSVDLARSGYDRPRAESFYRQLLAELRAQPGVQSAALAFHPSILNASLGNSGGFRRARVSQR